MQAVQITRYEKEIRPRLVELPVPEVGDTEVRIRVKAAAVNPVDLLILRGEVRLIQDYAMPLTLGNECAGVVDAVGRKVTAFRPGDRVYARLPISRPGAFAEYAAVEQDAVARMPAGYGFAEAAAIPLTGLTAYQAMVEEMEAKPGQTLLIPGGSGSLGQMAVPLARSLGLRVLVTGNARARERFLDLGAERYLDYRQENYWEVLSGVDHVLDALGPSEFSHELSVLKPGGRLVSLRALPNRAFALRTHAGPGKRLLFTLAGARYDRAARKQGKEYRFLFVRSDGAQLAKITKLVEQHHIVPAVDSRTFSLAQAKEALELVAHGHTDGKVILIPEEEACL